MVGCCFVLIDSHLIQCLPMVLPFGIEEIQRAVIDAHHLGEGIAAEVHDGFEGAGLQVDVVQGAETVVD